jgi:hypothetical protein
MKTGPETAAYLQAFNRYCKKLANSGRSRVPQCQKASTEIAQLNPAVVPQKIRGQLKEWENQLRSNHSLELV